MKFFFGDCRDSVGFVKFLLYLHMGMLASWENWIFSFIGTWVSLKVNIYSICDSDFEPLIELIFVLVGHDWWYRKSTHTTLKHNCLQNRSMHVDHVHERSQTQLCLALLWMVCLFWLMLTFILFTLGALFLNFISVCCIIGHTFASSSEC